VQHVPVFPEYVNLLHARDRLHIQLQRTLKLSDVLCVQGFQFAHYLSPHCALPARMHAGISDQDTYTEMQTTNMRPDVADMNVPILFEATCACSLASFAGSMVELTEDLRL
jgi:hypothetical protein